VKQSKELLVRNEKVSLSQVYQARASLRMETFSSFTDPQIASVRAKVIGAEDRPSEKSIANFDELSHTEKIQYRNAASRFMIAMDNTLYQYNLGLVEEVDFELGEEIISTFKLWEHMRVAIPVYVRRYYDQHNND